ncbi:DUF6339 family protein [Streptomyces aidingensis]|uniref:Uncharacterized protein n=1 Tax=Streptomyces aidingensis TaxID=910347 RepID=A0A1I1TVX0_9ACTN|nr:DUF6339 family protein [Streptomyces aidingensis]SFD62654.1 hypothetical protein SAMN05421773_12159 [Streptomyces aidingensis]
MTRHIDDLPERIGLLRDAAAARLVARGVLTGQEEPPLVAAIRAAEPIEDDRSRWDVRPIRELLDEAMRRHPREERAQADAWLAPRLHATLRITRAEAADTGVWNFLALVVGPDYLVWRHLPTRTKDGETPAVTADRFRGLHYKQGFARLWWAAELFRDADDYRPAVVACRNQDVLNTVLRLDIIDHRPTARAVTRLLEQGTVTIGREVNALATAINTAASTLMYDVMAPDDGPDADGLRQWIDDCDLAPPASLDTLPDGPDDGPIPSGSVDTLVKQFEKLFAEAPVRGREAAGTTP